MPESSVTNEDGYRLGRGYIAASRYAFALRDELSKTPYEHLLTRTARLNLQHFLYKEANGFLLHSTIQDYLRRRQESGQDGNKEPLHVADLATGTG